LGVVTIRDIAKRAGVSVATVSRTLREPDAVRPAKRDLVNQAIAEMKYVPNAIAQQLRRPRHEAIIVIVPEIANPFFSGIVQSIENVAHDLGYRVLIGETQGKQERLDYYAEMVTSRIAGGLILLGSLLPSVVRSSLEAGKAMPIPMVLACESFQGLDCPQVGIDNVAAARLAVQHLLQAGCRAIATITGPMINPLSADRLRGFGEALAMDGAGLGAVSAGVVEGNFSIESGYTGMLCLLNQDRRPDAVFCANDEMAIGAQKAIYQNGLRIPEDVAVVGFDDLRFGAFATPSLTTIGQPTAELGETATRMMDALLHGKGLTNNTVVLAHQLIVRRSSGGEPT
jgi:LacI family transcriptional regulator, repressor for deo operon, udp, cdd, tsx, nupC, and nupG